VLRIRLRTILLLLVGLIALGGVVSTIPNINLGFYSSKNCGVGSTSLLVDFGTGATPMTSETCAADFTGTGWQLFAATETTVEGTADFPSGFVCRIEDVPAAEKESCTSTPGADAGRWAYFYATAATGSTWHYSLQGAATRHPACGDWDGWRYLLPGENPKDHPPRMAAKPYRCN